MVFFSQGEKALEELKKCSGNEKIHLKPLDVSSLKDVKRFAENIRREFPRIHVLINNAGMAGNLMAAVIPGEKTKMEESVDGLELILATNYLGPFLLTENLKESLVAAGEDGQEPSR